MPVDNQTMAYLMDMIKDELAGMAREAYNAQRDGKIDWMEGIRLGNKGLSAATAIMGAFEQLGSAGVEQFLTVLENSDLTITPPSDNPFKR